MTYQSHSQVYIWNKYKDIHTKMRKQIFTAALFIIAKMLK